jgi:hypothetical protein
MIQFVLTVVIDPLDLVDGITFWVMLEEIDMIS